MTAIILLFLVGIVLLVCEVFAPGAVLGVFGGSAMLAGVVMAFFKFGITGGSIAALAAIVLLGAALYIEFSVLPRTKTIKRFVMGSTVHATSQPPLAAMAQVIDQIGEAVTTLAPSGYVTLNGRRYEAFSQSGHVAKGAKIKVVDLDNFRLIVTQIQSSP